MAHPLIGRIASGATALAVAGALALGFGAVPAQAAGNAPVAHDDHFEMNADTTLTVGAPGILGNDTDADSGATLHGASRTPVTVGTIPSYSAWDGAFTYVPPAGFTGQATFTYTVKDDENLVSASATVTIDVKPAGTPVVLPPTAVKDSYKYAAEVPLYIAAPGVLANDNSGGAPLTVSLDYVPAQVDVTMANDGSFLYTPPASMPYFYWFKYRICNTVSCSIGTVELNPTVPGEQPSGPSEPPVTVNSAPVAVDDVIPVTSGATASLTAPGVLGNDSDAENDALTVKSVSNPLHGQILSWQADGSISYRADGAWTGTDHLTYVVSDGTTDVAGKVDFVITEPTNYAPIGQTDYATIRSGSTLTLPLDGVLANDTDIDGDALTASILTNAEHGTAAIAADGTVSYSPDADFIGQDRVEYVVSDGKDSATADLYIEVTDAAAPLAPGVLGERYRTISPETDADALGVPAPGLLGNDFSRSGKPLSVTLESNDGNGTVTIHPDGSFTYLPLGTFTGTAHFTYQVSDGTGTTRGIAAVQVGGAEMPAAPAPAAVASTAAPTISGSFRYTKTLTASPGSWSAKPAYYSYQWLRNGAPISGATGSSYKLGYTDIYDRISVKVTTHRWGFANASAKSASAEVQKAKLTSTPTPKISGIAKAGRVLTAKAGTWGPGTVTLKYRWLRNGKPISGATSSKYRLTSTDKGKRISVRVTGSKKGYLTVAKTSAYVRIAS